MRIRNPNHKIVVWWEWDWECVEKCTWPLKLLRIATPVGTFVQINQVQCGGQLVSAVFHLQIASFVEFHLSCFIVFLSQIVTWTEAEQNETRKNIIMSITIESEFDCNECRMFNLPISRIDVNCCQHVIIEHEPDTPWHLQVIRDLLIIACEHTIYLYWWIK